MFVGYSDEGKRRTSVTFFAILLARTPPGEPTHVGHSIGGLFTA